MVSKRNNLKLRWHDINPFKLLLAKMPNSMSAQCEYRQRDFNRHVPIEVLSLRLIQPITALAPISDNTGLKNALLSTKGMGTIKTKKLLDEIDRVIWEIDKEPLYYGYPKTQDIIQLAFPLHWRELNAKIIATDGSYRKGDQGAGCGLAWEPNHGINCHLLGVDNVYPAELMAILIVSDSESAISAINNFSCSWQYKIPTSSLPYGQLLSQIHQVILARSFQVSFLWTKSHSKNSNRFSILNEMADTQANIGRNSINIIKVPNNYSDEDYSKPQLA